MGERPRRPVRLIAWAAGAPIAYHRQGSGPAAILVGGGLVDPVTGRAGRWENAPLASELAQAAVDGQR